MAAGSQPRTSGSKRGTGLKFAFDLYRKVACFTRATRIKYGPNPKTRGSKSFDRYASYAKAKTVGQAMELGVRMADFLWDYQRGYFKVTGGPVSKVPGLLAKDKGSSGAEVLSNFRGPRGCSLKMDAAKRRRLETLASRLGVDLEVSEDASNLAFNESADLRTERTLANVLAGRKLSESSSRGRVISDQDVLEVLQVWGFAENIFRLNVMPKGKQFVYSDTLGLMRTRSGVYHLTDPTLNYPNVTKLLMHWWADNRPPGWGAHFACTSINLNCDYAARVHRDQNNVGPSAIRALGSFEGGRLRYWPCDTKRPRPPAESLCQGDAQALDIRKRFVMFDGNRAHGVESFTGQRFSAVFFTARGFHKAGSQDREKLKSLGFAWPADRNFVQLRRLLHSHAGNRGVPASTGRAASAPKKRKAAGGCEGSDGASRRGRQ